MLQKLFESLYVHTSNTNCGVVICEKNDLCEVFFIDTGNTDEDGEQLLSETEDLFKTLNKKFIIKGIINTHAHADHAGANDYIFQKTHCQIYISEDESGTLINPFLQGTIAYGGNPVCELKTKYMLAKRSYPTKKINSSTIINLKDNAKICFIPLLGHNFEMMGIFYTAQNGKTAFFTGDGVFGREHIAKYSIPYLNDVKEFFNSLNVIENTKADYYIPSHGTIVTRIEETVEMTKIAILSTKQSILKALEKKELTQEEIVKKVCDMNKITLKPLQYFLISCTIRSYLTYFSEEKKIKYFIKDNIMYWKKL